MQVPGLSLELSDTVARLWIERPDRGNAFTPEMFDAVPELVGAAANRGARVLVVQGRGDRAFSAGYDIQRLSDSFGDQVDAGGESLQRAIDSFATFGGATVAMVNGPAIGGGVLLAIACDLRYAHERAFFQIPVARLGLIYPLRGIRDLVGTIGSGRCLEMLHTARRVSAEQALLWGLVNAVGTGDQWADEGEAAIAAMASLAPLSLAGHHHLVRHLIRGSFEPKIAEILARRALDSSDAREGAAAMVQKRPPQFTGS